MFVTPRLYEVLATKWCPRRNCSGGPPHLPPPSPRPPFSTSFSSVSLAYSYISPKRRNSPPPPSVIISSLAPCTDFPACHPHQHHHYYSSSSSCYRQHHFDSHHHHRDYNDHSALFYSGRGRGGARSYHTEPSPPSGVAAAVSAASLLSRSYTSTSMAIDLEEVEDEIQDGKTVEDEKQLNRGRTRNRGNHLNTISSMMPLFSSSFCPPLPPLLSSTCSRPLLLLSPSSSSSVSPSFSSFSSPPRMKMLQGNGEEQENCGVMTTRAEREKKKKRKGEATSVNSDFCHLNSSSSIGEENEGIKEENRKITTENKENQEDDEDDDEDDDEKEQQKKVGLKREEQQHQDLNPMMNFKFSSFYSISDSEEISQQGIRMSILLLPPPSPPSSSLPVLLLSFSSLSNVCTRSPNLPSCSFPSSTSCVVPAAPAPTLFHHLRSFTPSPLLLHSLFFSSPFSFLRNSFLPPLPDTERYTDRMHHYDHPHYPHPRRRLRRGVLPEDLLLRREGERPRWRTRRTEEEQSGKPNEKQPSPQEEEEKNANTSREGHFLQEDALTAAGGRGRPQRRRQRRSMVDSVRKRNQKKKFKFPSVSVPSGRSRNQKSQTFQWTVKKKRGGGGGNGKRGGSGLLSLPASLSRRPQRFHFTSSNVHQRRRYRLPFRGGASVFTLSKSKKAKNIISFSSPSSSTSSSSLSNEGGGQARAIRPVWKLKAALFPSPSSSSSDSSLQNPKILERGRKGRKKRNGKGGGKGEEDSSSSAEGGAGAVAVAFTRASLVRQHNAEIEAFVSGGPSDPIAFLAANPTRWPHAQNHLVSSSSSSSSSSPSSSITGGKERMEEGKGEGNSTTAGNISAHSAPPPPPPCSTSFHFNKGTRQLLEGRKGKGRRGGRERNREKRSAHPSFYSSCTTSSTAPSNLSSTHVWTSPRRFSAMHFTAMTQMMQQQK